MGSLPAANRRWNGWPRVRPSMIFAQLGMTLVLVALFCAAVAEYLVGQPVFDTHRPVLAAGVGGLGVLVILVGVVAAKRRQTKKLPDPGKLVDFLEPRFWGGVILVLGLLTFNFQTWGLDLRWLEWCARLDGQAQIVQAREPAEPDKPEKPAPKAVSVPLIKIQGIIFKKERPVVLIDGEAYEVGAQIDDAVIQEITREGIVVKIGRETKVIRMGTGKGMSGAAAGRK